MEKLPTHLLAKASEHRLQAALSPAATIGDLLELADRWQSGFEIDLGSWSLRLDEHEKENKIRYHGWGEHYTYYALSFLLGTLAVLIVEWICRLF